MKFKIRFIKEEIKIKTPTASLKWLIYNNFRNIICTMKYWVILLTLIPVLIFSACSDTPDIKRLDIPEIELNTLDELSDVNFSWESDDSGNFSHITSYSNKNTIYFNIDYEFPDNIFIYQTEIDGKMKYGYMDEYFQKYTETISNDPNIFNYGLARITDDDGSYIIDSRFTEIEEYYPGFKLIGNDLLIVNWTDKPVENPYVIPDVDFDTFLVPVKINEELNAGDINDKTLYGYKTINNLILNDDKSYDDFVIPPEFKAADLFYEGLAAVKINGKWGYINETGEIVINPEYDNAGNFYRGAAPVYDANYHKPFEVLKYGYTDENDLGRWGMINMRGNTVTLFKYRSIGPFINDLSFAVVATQPQNTNIYEILRPDGIQAYMPSQVFGPEARAFLGDPLQFSDGLIPVLWGSYVFMNEEGEKAFENEFSNARGFSDGMAAVQPKKEIRWGYIDLSGNMVFPAIYTYACDFDEGYAYVREHLSSEGYLIDKMGNHYLEDLELHGITKFNEDGNALGFKRETKEVGITNEKTGMYEKVIKTFYTYYIINVIY